ncbi:uncharacterized protein LOC108837175 [Raphanus sativus]|uniref:Uncharacterized protein LOC108837175 n=1 Tax=Raphanus sativus TaxID=3726 RepID=A0A6J0M100_RAPSA|nr:uncharacterized protein LOC108837175 [Raphanus sativus]
MYPCMYADRETYVKNNRQKDDHYCYPCVIYSALKFASKKGIPLANEDETNDNDFSCKVERRLQAGEQTLKIKEVYHYETLKEALKRLKTHIVCAILLCYAGWADGGLYTGPKERACLQGHHEVVMVACVMFQGKMVIKCKSSNGTDVGNDGYIYVDPEVYFIEIASSRKRYHESSCRIKPTPLLFDFYSLDMDTGPHGVKFSEEEFNGQKMANEKFKVHFQITPEGGPCGMCYTADDAGISRLCFTYGFF